MVHLYGLDTSINQGFISLGPDHSFPFMDIQLYDPLSSNNLLRGFGDVSTGLVSLPGKYHTLDITADIKPFHHILLIVFIAMECCLLLCRYCQIWQPGSRLLSLPLLPDPPQTCALCIATHQVLNKY